MGVWGGGKRGDVGEEKGLKWGGGGGRYIVREERQRRMFISHREHRPGQKYNPADPALQSRPLPRLNIQPLRGIRAHEPPGRVQHQHDGLSPRIVVD